MTNSEGQPNQLKDTQILAILEIMMPKKKNDSTNVYASSEEETGVGEERIQPGPMRAQLHVNVDKLDEVREAGTDGDESTSHKIMFDAVDEEFEGAMDDEKVWQSIPKEVRVAGPKCTYPEKSMAKYTSRTRELHRRIPPAQF
jgi:hypothetical protein